MIEKNLTDFNRLKSNDLSLTVRDVIGEKFLYNIRKKYRCQRKEKTKDKKIQEIRVKERSTYYYIKLKVLKIKYFIY